MFHSIFTISKNLYSQMICTAKVFLKLIYGLCNLNYYASISGRNAETTLFSSLCVQASPLRRVPRTLLALFTLYLTCPLPGPHLRVCKWAEESNFGTG